MKAVKIIVLLFLLLLIFAVSCSNTGEVIETTQTEQSDAATDVTTARDTEFSETTIEEITTQGEITEEITTEYIPKWEGEDMKIFNMSKYCISASGNTDNAADAVAYIQNVFKTLYGIDIPEAKADKNCISVTVSGDRLDWSVKLNEDTGVVTLKGGSREAVLRAAYALTTYVSAADESKPTVTRAVEYSYTHSTDSIDNSNLIKYTDSKDVTLSAADSDGKLMAPEWVDSLIMVEIRPDTASIGGTLPECYDMLDFYASIGVNGIWLAPIYERGAGENGYGNYGPHTLEPAIVGTTDLDEGWNVVKEFVDYAHSKGIYVFLDIITWGTMKSAPLIEEHPTWFSGEAWGNAAFNWRNKELVEWFTQTLVDNINKTGADGYRCDCEPNYTGYDMYNDVKTRLAEQGKHIIIISEDGNVRKSTYVFEQDGVLKYSAMSRGELYQKPVNLFGDGYLNLVDSVKTGEGIGSEATQKKKSMRGTFKYYTNCITNHDYQRRDVCGSRVNIGYSAILAPFIPVWYMGDEFNAQNNPGVLYDLPVNYNDMNTPENSFFLEDVKKFVEIRRTNSDIFENWPLNHRESNICEVKTENFGTVQNYARYGDKKAILVIANRNSKACTGKVTIPFDECGISGYEYYSVTDMMTGRVILSGTRDEIETFTACIPYNYVGVYQINVWNK